MGLLSTQYGEHASDDDTLLHTSNDIVICILRVTVNTML
jgi:hypothetical protein